MLELLISFFFVFPVFFLFLGPILFFFAQKFVAPEIYEPYVAVGELLLRIMMGFS